MNLNKIKISILGDGGWGAGATNKEHD